MKRELEIFTGNIYTEKDVHNLIDEVSEIFINELDTIESVYVIIKKVIKSNGNQITVEAYNISDLIN